jgi:hypothetical protein
MRELPIGRLGRITTGDELGRVVEIVDDSDRTGGFLIFTYADFDRSPEVFDGWVETFADVGSYFDESGWEIEWADPPG